MGNIPYITMNKLLIYNKLTSVVKTMRYVFLISLLLSNNAACTKNIRQENTPLVQQPVNETIKRESKNVLTDEESLALAQYNRDISGYNPGNPDGRLTPKTQAKLLQEKSGLPPRGKLTQETAMAGQKKQKIEQERLLSPTRKEQPPQFVEPKPVYKQQKEKTNGTVIPTPSVSEIQTVGVHRVAAYLAEIGYFEGSLKQAKLKDVEMALKLFQRDIKVAETGLLDDKTWKTLQKIKLNPARQAELASVKTMQPAKEQLDPPMSTFSLKQGESIFAIEKIECKSPHEAFVLYYKGELQQIQDDKVQVRANEHYALWYDRRRQGFSKTDWWCIPRKRFCSSNIAFSDWGGQIKAGEVSHFNKKWTIPSRFDIASLVASSTEQLCQFTAQATPPKKKISAHR